MATLRIASRVVRYDPHALERKWQRRWARARVYEATAKPGRPKWFGNVPYPYMNGYLHLGQGLSFLRAEFQARYRRMAGHNVLFAQGFHCTGLPILGAARRVAEREPRQLQILREMGFAEAELPKFADPEHWVRTFPRDTREHLRALGAAVDWRRTFITTPLNPPYDAFVRWQYRRLRDRGYVRLGSKPVIWCTRDQAPIGDHDRLEGEGVTPVAFTVLKFPMEGGRFLVAATLRPETVYGQTNLWVAPDAAYVEARVDGQRWIVSRAAAAKLGEQGKSVEVLSELRGRDLVGTEAVAPMIHRPIPVLPSTFIDLGRGTGIVTSVPSDAPDDWVALRDLQRDEALARSFGLDPERVKAIQPVPIIRSKGYGPLPAVEVVDRMDIASQREGEKLAAAKEEVYRAGFYEGVMGDAAGPYAGQPVQQAKDRIAEELVRRGEADVLWEPGGSVVCRCTTPAIVKIVDDQWFLPYGDAAWKKRTHAALDRMVCYPEAVRKQFHYVIDWLRDWACTHHQGLGTKLPWDDHWVIESLSDSTIYMAYYAIAHALQAGEFRSKVRWAPKLDDGFFDYVFLGRGNPAGIARRLGVSPAVVRGLRREFAYWYPFDLRNTGKDLVQNHMIFCLFSHVAVFPQALWPTGFGVNGWVSVSGRKMSKSRGGAIYLGDAVRDLGADPIRLAVGNAGDGLDDPAIDTDFAASAVERIGGWLDAVRSKPKVRAARLPIDGWFASVLHRAIADARVAMEALEYKAALRHGYFGLQSAWDWYLRRSGGVPNRVLRRTFLEVQTKILAPFVPHAMEEAWRALGHRGLVVASAYPRSSSGKIRPEVEAAERFLRSTLDDVREILRVTGIAPTTVTLFTAPAWKTAMFRRALALAGRGKVEPGPLIREALVHPALRPRGEEVAAAAKKIASEVASMGEEERATRAHAVDERRYLEASVPFLEGELRSKVVVADAEKADGPAAAKAKQAFPGRAAILVE